MMIISLFPKLPPDVLKPVSEIAYMQIDVCIDKFTSLSLSPEWRLGFQQALDKLFVKKSTYK